MRRFAFIIAIFGLFIMAILLNKSPKEIGSVDEINRAVPNERVLITGRIVSERNLYAGVNLLKTEKGVELVCECDGAFSNKTIRATGKIEEYEGRKQIKVYEISVLN